MKVSNRRARGTASGVFYRSALAALVAMGFSAHVGAQQIYGWTDSSGQVTYSNLPPPKGAKVTDVIPDMPLSPQAVQEAARRSEISALNDRIRLLELEQARSRREVVDYPAQPASPLSASCSPDGYGDCNSQWGPYYTTGFLYEAGKRHEHDGSKVGHDNGRAGRAPIHVAPPSKPQASPIAAGPNRSSLQQR